MTVAELIVYFSTLQQNLPVLLYDNEEETFYPLDEEHILEDEVDKDDVDFSIALDINGVKIGPAIIFR